MSPGGACRNPGDGKAADHRLGAFSLASRALGQSAGPVPPQVQPEVFRRLVDLEETDPEILAEIEASLRDRLSQTFALPRKRVAGLSAVEGILNASDRKTEKPTLPQSDVARSTTRRPASARAARVRRPRANRLRRSPGTARRRRVRPVVAGNGWCVAHADPSCFGRTAGVAGGCPTSRDEPSCANSAQRRGGRPGTDRSDRPEDRRPAAPVRRPSVSP